MFVYHQNYPLTSTRSVNFTLQSHTVVKWLMCLPYRKMITDSISRCNGWSFWMEKIKVHSLWTDKRCECQCELFLFCFFVVHWFNIVGMSCDRLLHQTPILIFSYYFRFRGIMLAQLALLHHSCVVFALLAVIFVLFLKFLSEDFFIIIFTQFDHLLSYILLLFLAVLSG